jgi:hypothetical protein
MSTYAGENFGQDRPPLSIIIKGILKRYPDGQIFKVRLTLTTSCRDLNNNWLVE